MAEPFRHRLRVRWAECDPQGVVFYPNYLALMDVAVTELWRAAVRPYAEMVEAGADMVVAEANVRYREPARFDEEIELCVSVRRLGGSSIATSIEIRRAADAALLTEGELRHVVVDPTTLAKREMPPEVRDGLSRYLADS